MTVDLKQAGTFLALAAFSSERSAAAWHAHVLERLRKGASDHKDTGIVRPVDDLLSKISEEAADLGGWSAITRQAVDAQELPEDVVDQLDLILYAVAELGAQAHAKVNEARELLQEAVTR